jgi:hypothetical protein
MYHKTSKKYNTPYFPSVTWCMASHPHNVTQVVKNHSNAPFGERNKLHTREHYSAIHK